MVTVVPRGENMAVRRQPQRMQRAGSHGYHPTPVLGFELTAVVFTDGQYASVVPQENGMPEAGSKMSFRTWSWPGHG